MLVNDKTLEIVSFVSIFCIEWYFLIQHNIILNKIARAYLLVL